MEFIKIPSSKVTGKYQKISKYVAEIAQIDSRESAWICD